jgi:hypothetical protein
VYALHLFFDLSGDVDYMVDARANFVVIDDLTMPATDPDKYRLYIWEDICPQPKPLAPLQVKSVCMTRILTMYK